MRDEAPNRNFPLLPLYHIKDLFSKIELFHDFKYQIRCG